MVRARRCSEAPWRLGWSLAIASAALVLSCPQPSGASPTVRVEATGGFDSNAARSETTTDGAGLARLVAELGVRQRLSRDWRLSVVYHGGARRFFDAAQRGEDGLFQRADAHLLGRLIDGLALGVDVGVRDRTTRDPVHPRDFTHLRLAAPLSGALGPVRLTAGPLVDRFLYKPDTRYDADGVGGRLGASLPLDAWRLAVYGEWLSRSYRGGVDPGAGESDPDREDALTAVGGSVRYTGAWLGALSYGFSRNASTRAEGGYDRHALTLSATVPLPARLVASARLHLIRIIHEELLLLPGEQVLEDEGRSAVNLRLERPLAERWSLVAHGGYWTSPFATGPAYARWQGLLGVAYGE